MEDPEVAGLYRAGRSINFIAVHLRMSTSMVRSHLLAYGLIDPIRRRPSGKGPSSSTMKDSTLVPVGDPLLKLLRIHYPERDPFRQPGQKKN